MCRALPGRARDMAGPEAMLLAAITTAHSDGQDIGAFIATGLAGAAARLGSSAELLQHRPGSWGSALAADLVRGLVGGGDEELGMFGSGGAGGSL